MTVFDEVTVVTLQRPDKLNALTSDMRRRLAAEVRASTARGIVVTGAGRAFCAGEDLYEARNLSLVEEVETFHDLTRSVLETRVPVVAAINGLAVGGAAEWTLCFDARIGTPAAEYFLPENGIGLSISNASSFLLPRLVGGRALRMVLDRPRLNAKQALAAGLLDEIVEPDTLIDTAIDLVRRWTEPGTATAVHLELLRPSLDEVEHAFASETEAAKQVEDSGIAALGMERFANRKN
ncbi:MAG TPA: enoyl-CoA hydratase/isomerase family protein [Jiangellaceae bacterium]